MSPPSFFHIASAPGRTPCTRPQDYQVLAATLRRGLQAHPVPVLAYSLLPRQWQLVAGPSRPTVLASLLAWVNTALGGGDLHVLDTGGAGDLVRVCRLVERLPLDVGLVRRAQDWPWSSLTCRLHPGTGLPLVAADFLTTRAWVDYVNQGDRSPWRSGHVAEAPRRLA